MNKTGRKSLKEEIKITQRYADLSEKAFKLISKKLDSEDKHEQNFALDWLKGGFARMIPQKIGGDPDNQAPIPISILQGITQKDVPTHSSPT